MATLWHGLEIYRDWNAVAEVWRRRIGPENFQRIRSTLLNETERRARTFPSREICQCRLRVVQHGPDHIVGVSDCETNTCRDVKLTTEEITVLELPWKRIARAIVKALGCELREADLGIDGTRQIGAFGGESIPVILALPADQRHLSEIICRITAHVSGPFILLTPTSCYLDVNSRALLDRAKAGHFALDTILTLLPNGSFHARQTAGELFSRYLPKTTEPTSDSDAVRLFALVQALDTKGTRGVSVMTVFQKYCIEGLSAEVIAGKCECSKGTVMNRLAAIEKATGTKADKLRAFSPQFQKVEESLSDSRAREVYRRGTIEEDEEEEL